MATKGIEIGNNDLDGHHIRDFRTRNLEMAAEHEEYAFNAEAGQIRSEVLHRLTANKNQGILSEEEERFWLKKLETADLETSHLRNLKEDFDEHWRKAYAAHQLFEGTINTADKEGMLRQNEYQKLEDSFKNAGLKEKEKQIKDLEKELNKRQEEIKRFFKLETDVQGKRLKNLEKAENYTEKLKVLEAATLENKNFKTYKEIFKKHKDKLSEKTIVKYYNWFLTLSGGEQLKAINDIEGENNQEGIKPRIKIWEIHHALPPKYQASEFKDWGSTERQNYLATIEHKIEREYRETLRKNAKGVFSEKTIKFCEQAFNTPEPDFKKRLTKKIEFFEALPGHIEAEKRLWAQFEKFPEKIQDLQIKKFSEADFNEKKEMLSLKIPKLSDRYNKMLNKTNNKMDAAVWEIYKNDFENAKSIEEMENTVLTAEKFQKSKDNYFKKWENNAKYFKSKPDVYRDWHEENIHTLEAAQKAEKDLDGMIKVRAKIHNSTQKLPPHLQKRMDLEASLADRQKQIQKMDRLAEAYRFTIPFLVENGQKQEADKNTNGALTFYMQALKLDPASVELKTLVAHLRQNGAKITNKPASKNDKAQTEKILKNVDEMPEIKKETNEMARLKLLLDLSKKHAEQVGSTGTTTDARTQRSVRNLNKDDQDVAKNFLDEKSDDYIVDETGIVREKVKLKTSGEQTKKTTDTINEFYNTKQHKGDVTQKGAAEFAFVSDNNQEMELSTAEKNFKDRDKLLGKERRRNFHLKLVQNTDLSEAQIKKTMTLYDAEHQESELTEREMEKFKAA
ncbi:MAG: hypothetical protein UT55_C0029G0001 [Candidatus Peregrinibacteria bacterium GW2011_GWE2_39_6]|nr:MAG: hypothetical protein UT36_C0009G0001 [Candidatus Peregrinibacteria bacterium GW2011_GWF2_39_17]KKR25792.1 MAG: hypothetical protein UT55_C0029G0001 [Candidatus Peregrinibacteria bacterium GW2011_GWE2_39_6]HCW32754.1 hypothetical protein [Candidatus Peregrinibacteria bacterium]